jgi:predicted MPP superfamily phosphohydrolase
VAVQMSKTVAALGSKFVVNTGDNFYWCGLQNTSDFQVKADWLDPYGKHGLLDLPWYGVLGNHEYGYNVQASTTHYFYLHIGSSCCSRWAAMACRLC